MTVQTVERDLAMALFRLSFGRLSAEQARQVAPNYDMEDDMLGHKGINWYAKQLLAVM